MQQIYTIVQKSGVSKEIDTFIQQGCIKAV